MSDTLASLRPRPGAGPDTEPYWVALREGRLVLQQCADCQQVRHYPRPMCDACYSMDSRWVPARGTGKVHSWTETHHAFNPAFKGEVPYVMVTVDLHEGVRLNAQLRGAGAAALRIGAPVRIGFESVDDALVVPVVTLAG